MLHRVLFVPSLQKSWYTWQSVKSITKFALIYDGTLQVVCKTARSVAINTVQSSNHIGRDHVLSKATSLADDLDHNLGDTTLGHPFRINVNRNLYEGE
jgi:hypothetical protein